MPKPSRPTWIEIDRSALENNVRQLRRLIGPQRRLTAVVKANAYGHGAAPVAQIALAAGADALAVAALGEAAELRGAGVNAPILVLGYTPGWLAAEAVTLDATLAVFDVESACAYSEAAAAGGRTLRLHVKVNSGMNRLGVGIDDAPALIAQLAALPGLAVEGVFTHFATSDAADKSHAYEQLRRFTALLAALEAAGLRPPLAHAANSAALLTMPESRLDMVRAGIALYGLDPDEDDTPIPAEFRPVLAWKAVVAQVRSLAAGEAVSYGREFIAEQPMQVAVVPVGYADGFPRRPRHWGSVLVHGRAAPILGRVCMDQCIVDVTKSAAAGEAVRQGDEVVLIGRQSDAAISAEEAARRIGTINYDVTSRILSRVPRVVV